MEVHFNHSAKRSQPSGKSYASAVSEDIVPLSPTLKEGTSLTAEEFEEIRGERHPQDIHIETYTSEGMFMKK